MKTPADLGDRALIALTALFVSAEGAVLAMRVKDVDVPRRRLCVRLHGKGGKNPEIPGDYDVVEPIHLQSGARMVMFDSAAVISSRPMLHKQEGPPAGNRLADLKPARDKT